MFDNGQRIVFTGRVKTMMKMAISATSRGAGRRG